MPLSQLISIMRCLVPPRRGNERGLSQSTENAILLAGAATIALLIITVITNYVTDKLPG